jgi:uncharacterized protein YvpB
MPKLLDVPYFSQESNEMNPGGSCNVTSIGMALLFLGAKPRTDQRFPDELDEYCDAHNLDRHSPQDLVTVASVYGIKDTFSTTNTIESVKAWLQSGKPAVVHGYFTQSGHIVCLIGCDDTGFFVNDPYGEFFADGYDRNDADDGTKGKDLHYSNELIQRVCIGDDKSFWVHSLEKKS